MDEAERQMHLRAGREYGQESTCGQKMNFHTEEKAVEVAPRLSVKFGHEMEGYPCDWCGGWHIGRKMTDEERARFS
jgi:hypothetical protein